MRSFFLRNIRPARFGGPAFRLFLAALFAASSWLPASYAAPPGDHQAATAALADIKAAIAEIVQANDSYSTNRNFYHRASHRAINAIEGLRGPDAVPSSGTPGDPEGALGQLDALLHREGTAVWAVPLDGAEANLRAAVAYLMDANHARGVTQFQIATSRALGYLEVARGRPTDTGALGGMEGALANTALGVPDGAPVADACSAPSSAPSYGVHGGLLAWVAVPASAGTHALAENPGGRSVTFENGMIVLPTAVAAAVARACNSHASAAPAPLVKQAAVTPQADGGTLSALYTKTQAEAGAQLFASRCVACHGANLQGTAAPSVAGTDFLTIARKNGWTLEIIRYVVVTDMPFNAPASLSPTAYADVLAFLLASDCYPSGDKPFPTTDDPAFAGVKLGPVPGKHGEENKFGVCPVS